MSVPDEGYSKKKKKRVVSTKLYIYGFITEAINQWREIISLTLTNINNGLTGTTKISIIKYRFAADIKQNVLW